MEKIIRFTVLVFLMSAILLAWQQEKQPLDSDKEIKEVTIFESTEFKKEKSELIVSASDTKQSEIFVTVKSILVDARKQDGVVDMVEPNYYLEMIYEDHTRKEFHLWLMDVEGGKGSIMETEDTHNLYNFSEELNTQLIHLLNSAKD